MEPHDLEKLLKMSRKTYRIVLPVSLVAVVYETVGRSINKNLL